MKLSKNTLYLGIIVYCGALLIFQDWGNMASNVGTVSALFLGKMLLDLGFAGAAFVRLAGDSLFAAEESEDEIAIHAEDLHFSDTALFGLFLVNVIGNMGYHGYVTINTTGAVSTYYSIWFVAEFVVLFLTYILFSHAKKAQARLARESRRAAASNGSNVRSVG